jgi:nitrate reductase gamma subunit
MSTAVYVVSYVSVVMFAAGLLASIIRYKKKPLHVRWELYPVAHEGKKASYGGSYLEELDGAVKPRHRSLSGELKVMVPEILFLKAVRESNRSLWRFSFPFHAGLYCMAAFGFAVFLSALAEIAGMPGTRGVAQAINLLGSCGSALALVGALGLIHRRSTSPDLRDYTFFSHYFHLALFVFVMGFFLLSWAVNGFSFSGYRSFAINLLIFNVTEPVEIMTAVPAASAFALLGYIPWTHMVHFAMKYFLYHDIRWGDEPMTHSGEPRLGRALKYRPSWGAAHVMADGHRTWAEIAASNPTQKQREDSN